MSGIIPVEGSDRTTRVVVDQLDGGWSTRSFPHLISDRQLYVADNVVFNRNGLVSKRPGNIKYANGSGATGSGAPILNMTRFYPVGSPPQLIVHSGTQLYRGNDSTGAFTSAGTGLSSSLRARFAQAYDPDMTTGAATALVVCDGVHIPQLYDGTHFVPVQTGVVGGQQMLPNGRGGSPITPAYVANWREHLVYSGDPSEPTGVYISDALRPERFNGYGLLDSAGTPYTAYFPAGRDGNLGVVTGLGTIGPFLVVFYTSGIAVGINTGTYGAFQFQWAILSTTIGMPSPSSLAGFDNFLVFFGGDRFYATDGTSLVPLPDEIPSVYANDSRAAFPCEMVGWTSVVGIRHGMQYWASYDVVGAGRQTVLAVFDFAANGGWTYGAASTIAAASSGGTWSRWPTGMTVSCGVECRGPGDAQQMFWGSSTADLVAQHDVGGYYDFGLPIQIEIRGKAFFLDRPVWPKDVQALYVLGVFQVAGAQYGSGVTAYVVLDASTSVAPVVAIAVAPSGPQYGPLKYGQFRYGAGNQIITQSAKTHPQQDAKGYVVQPGVIEISGNPFNLLGFVIEVIVDEPSPVF